MAAPYKTKLQDLVDASLGADSREVVCNHFFSGAAAYLDGKIIATLSPVGLAIKLSESACLELLRLDAKPLRYFPKSPIKRNYVLFEIPGDLSSDRVTSLLIESVEHARQTAID